MELLRLRGERDVVVVNSGDPADFYPELETADAIIIRVGRMDERAFERAKNLKVVARTGVGYDSIDIAAANARGIPVVVTPGAVEHSVAEHTLTLFLALSKNLLENDRELKRGNWGIRNAGKGIELRGKKIGFVGYGRTGRLTARLFEALGVEILAYDPHLSADQIRSAGAGAAARIEDIFLECDMISVHVPLLDETRGMIDARLIGLMRETAFLVNCSRGGIVDERALADALNQGKIAGAGSDVFAGEPPAADNPLLGARNALLTPHVAGVTRESSAAAARMAVEGCLEVLAGLKYQLIANPQAYDHPRWK
jgi:D-3-phosphoglycerate dehydrogenase